MYLQSIKSFKQNAAKSVHRSILKKSRHKGFGFFIVYSSMVGVFGEGVVGGGLGTETIFLEGSRGGHRLLELSRNQVRNL
jgi:hypothetical protein